MSEINKYFYRLLELLLIFTESNNNSKKIEIDLLIYFT